MLRPKAFLLSNRFENLNKNQAKMKVEAICFLALCFVAFVHNQTTECPAKAEIIAAVKQLKTDHASAKLDDKQLIEELKRILEVIRNNVDKAEIEQHPQVLNFVKEIQEFIMIMEDSGKFDPKIFQEFDVFGQTMNPGLWE